MSWRRAVRVTNEERLEKPRGGKRSRCNTPAVRKTERLSCKEQRCCRSVSLQSTEVGRQKTEVMPTLGSARVEWHVIVYTEFVRYGATCNEEKREREKKRDATTELFGLAGTKDTWNSFAF